MQKKGRPGKHSEAALHQHQIALGSVRDNEQRYEILRLASQSKRPCIRQYSVSKLQRSPCRSELSLHGITSEVALKALKKRCHY